MPATPENQKCFVVELNGTAIFAFTAASMAGAKRLCSREWLAAELGRLTSSGQPLWRDNAVLKVRPAGEAEAAEIERARVREIADREYDGVVFAFLVPLDREPS